MRQAPIFDYLLLKLAARCDLKCTYCYWFRDKSVYDRPKLLTLEAEQALLQKLESHIQEYQLKTFSILFHGGEPLLFGKYRFVRLLDALKEIEKRTECRLNLSITTNGMQIDEEWAIVFHAFQVSTTLSLDGPESINDLVRVDHAGKGTYQKVINALTILRDNGSEPGLLAVCNPLSDPEIVTQHFAETLGLKHFDILIPDATHDDAPVQRIAPYYKRLFDLWYDHYSHRGITIRYPKAMLKGVLGGESHLESIGYGPIQTCVMLTDGSLEPLDVLRIAGYRTTSTKISIITNTFQDVTEEPIWREAFDSALQLCDTCNACEYRLACGGGFLPHRWAKDTRYNNPSVYCDDLKEIFSHIWRRVSVDITVVSDKSRINLMQAVQTFQT